MKIKLFHKLFGGKLYKNTKFCYSLSNCTISPVDKFDINNHKNGNVFIETNNSELIKKLSTVHLINATKELENGNLYVLHVVSESDVHLNTYE